MPMNPRLLRPRATNAAAPPSGTPASLLLRFDGNFNDSSPNALTVTVEGDASISTTTKKYGAGAGYFDGSAYLTAPSGASVSGTEDFTVEFWVWIAEAQDAQIIVQPAGGLTVSLGYGGLRVWAGSPSFATDSEDELSIETWHHIAVTRASGAATIWIDGVAKQTASLSDSFTAGQIAIGLNGGESLIGYLDDLRIVKGLAVYTSNFTPPTGPLSASV